MDGANVRACSCKVVSWRAVCLFTGGAEQFGADGSGSHAIVHMKDRWRLLRLSPIMRHTARYRIPITCPTVRLIVATAVS